MGRSQDHFRSGKWTFRMKTGPASRICQEYGWIASIVGKWSQKHRKIASFAYLRGPLPASFRNFYSRKCRTIANCGRHCPASDGPGASENTRNGSPTFLKILHNKPTTRCIVPRFSEDNHASEDAIPEARGTSQLYRISRSQRFVARSPKRLHSVQAAEEDPWFCQKRGQSGCSKLSR